MCWGTYATSPAATLAGHGCPEAHSPVAARSAKLALLLAHVGCHVGRRQRWQRSNRRERRAAQHQEELANAEDGERNREWDYVVEQSEQEPAGDHDLPVELPDRD